MKNILIFTHSNDISTDLVIKWLEYKNARYLRLNEDDKIAGIDIISDDDIKLKYRSCTVSLKDYDTYWYRRPGGTDFAYTIKNYFDKYYSNYCSHELESILPYIENSISNHSLNNFKDRKNDKLLCLQIAKQVGLNVPNWIITDDIDVLQNFQKTYEKIITKPMNMPYFNIMYSNKNYEISYCTNIVTREQINNLTENNKNSFYPTFFQEYIDKYIEIRCFVVKGAIFSMAIFSQQNENTKIDCRMDSREKPLRCVPFLLPEELENTVRVFMNEVNIDSGSIDFILSSADDKFYFLEVNPIGQFTYVSRNCNYNIEKIIGEYLYGE